MDTSHNIQPYFHNRLLNAPYNYLIVNHPSNQQVAINFLPPSKHHKADEQGLLKTEVVSGTTVVRNVLIGAGLFTATSFLLPVLLLPLALALAFLMLSVQNQKEKQRDQCLEKEFKQPFSRYRTHREKDTYILYKYAPLHNEGETPNYQAEKISSVPVEEIEQISELEEEAYELERQAENNFVKQLEASKISQIINQQIAGKTL